VDAGRPAKQAGVLAEQIMLDDATLQETQCALAQEILDPRAGADEFARDARPDYLWIDSALKETSAAVADVLESAKRQHAAAEEMARTQAAAYGSGVFEPVPSFFESLSESSTGLGSTASRPHWTSPNSGGGSTASSGGGGGSTDWGSSSNGGGSTSW
jgi:uncharacterized membrane protein YgcG